MEAISTLAGGIAHGFNNLLMGIQGRTALMYLQTGPDHPHFEHLKGIEDCVKSSAKLTKQLLGFARGGKYEVKPTDMNEIIDKSAVRFGRIKKEIIIRVESQPDIWSVEVDQKQIEQVFLNLYVNAWQAMPEGGDLYIQTENVVVGENFKRPYQVEPGKYVQISLTDAGVGMDKETQKRIFDPFFTTKRMDRGAGLGLASVYGIIKNHGGFIDVYSEKDKGTTFKIHLPA
jgi:signal transduction histidine kinase